MTRASQLAFANINPRELSLSHSVDVDAHTGAALVRVPLAVSPGRANFTPQFTLEYASTTGNSPFGLGWTLSGLLTISVNTRKGLPNYDGRDGFVFNGNGELLPVLELQGGTWQPAALDRDTHWVRFFRGRVERNFIRIEQWTDKASGRIHWRTHDVHDVVTIYGLDPSGLSRISDPANGMRTLTWLPDTQYDPHGNAIVYEYAAETRDGVDLSLAYEQSRRDAGLAQRYLKRVHYGNTQPIQPDAPIPNSNAWMFEVVFDYGDHDPNQPTPAPDRVWAARPDSFSTYRPGFEVRTYRLCRRVLQFHNFAALGPQPVRVGAYTLEHDLDPAGSTLVAVQHTRFRSDAGQASHRSLPPLRIRYAAASVASTFHPAPIDTFQNLPQGLDGGRYRWIDLYGEGLPGILSETGQAWYFKPNDGGGRFGPQRLVIDRPAYRLGQCALNDFDGDGNANLAVFHGRQGGFYEYKRDTDTWDGFRPFAALPHLEAAGAKAQWLDLNGDGRNDLFLADPERLTWYPSLGKDGFGAPIEVASLQTTTTPSAPLAEEVQLDFLFADMSGDGLLDQVRVTNGRVEYWPHQGNGRFGGPILMEGAPIFAPDGEFDPRRLLLVDLDGNGVADIIYIGNGELRYWINAAGNTLIEGGQLTSLPYIDNLASLQVLDFLGDGTLCLVWSSPLPEQASPIQYLQLTNGVKPRLLLDVDNSMGMETRLGYSSSAAHYLRDKRTSRAWQTKLPNHVFVVDQRDVIDQIGGAHATTRYEYHDGAFDGQEQIFRGFGLVDQFDTMLLASDPAAPQVAFSAPSCLRTWFHPGRGLLSPPDDCYSGDPLQATLVTHSFENSGELSMSEYEDGLRTLAGLVIRQELFAVSIDGARSTHPFQVVQNAYRLRRLQPARDTYEACFSFYASERLTYDYEQQPDDPRIAHDLFLDVDPFGHVLLECDVAYARREGILAASSAQSRIAINARAFRYVHLTTADHYAIGIPIETREFEIAGLMPENANVFGWDEMRQTLAVAIAAPLDYHENFSGIGQARLVGWERSFFWDDALGAMLSHGKVGMRVLLHHHETACFTTTLINELFGPRVNAPLLQNEGTYREQDGYWWQTGDTQHYSNAAGFFRLARIERLDGSTTTFTYDTQALALVTTEDALINRVRAEIDYHLIAPHRITDPNDNVAEVLYDPLGVAVVSTVHGQVLDAGGATQNYGQNPLTAYTPRDGATFDAVLANPAFFLQSAAQYVYYELDTWQSSGTPLRMITLMREEFTHDGTGGGTANSRTQIELSYADGFRRALQRKTLVEPGLAFGCDANGNLVLDAQGRPVESPAAVRWLVAGHTVYNQKQQVVRQYEPFFSATATYEDEVVLAQLGVFQQFQYDAVGRLVREEMPNGTVSRVVIDAWETRHFDPNDAVVGTPYQTLRQALPNTDPENQALAKAEAHANTPLIIHLDSHGGTVKQIETALDGNHRTTEYKLDHRGQVAAILDPRGLTTFRYRRDMQGRVLSTHSVDAGDTLTLPDMFDRPIHEWDSRNVHQRRSFDMLDRLTAVFVNGALGLSHLVEQMTYGEDPSVAQAKLRNARGRLVFARDQSGTITVQQYNLTGQPLQTERQVRQEYKTEPDWANPGMIMLDPVRHATTSTFDALGRIHQQSLPDGTTRQLEYQLGGGLARLSLSSADGKLNNVVLCEGSSFNARGQRNRVLLGNGVEIRHVYDPATFRTARITTIRPPANIGNAPDTLQDLVYTYDPIGNITRRVDEAQQPAHPGAYIQGLNVSAASDYTYDAFYQLIKATGRVHQALLEHDYRPDTGQPDGIKGTRHLHFNNGAAVERYTETYEYDLAGNTRRVHHQGVLNTWDTQYWISPNSNRSLQGLDPNGTPISNPEARFDPNGNCTFLPHLRRLDWNYRNNIARAVIIDRASTGETDDAEYYVYDGGGQRVRKVTERLVGGQVEITDTLYLDGCEIKRVRRGAQMSLERLSSHVSDGVSRIALVHRWNVDTLARETDNVAQARVRYQLSDHLGSAHLELDERGAVIGYEEFLPYGGTAFIAGDQLREVEARAYRFCGKERDDATSLYYFGFRYYAAWLGRWISPDPLGPEGDPNLYRYVFNNPINLADPDGLRPTRGHTVAIEADRAPSAVIDAWNTLPADRRAALEQSGFVWRIDRTTGHVQFLTREQARQQIEASLSAGQNVGIYRFNSPDAGGESEGDTEPSVEGNETPDPGGGTQISDQPPRGAEHGEDGTGGGAQGADGGAADGGGTSDSGDPSASDVHAGDGSSTSSTTPTGGDGGGNGTGTGLQGSGPGGGGIGPGVPGGQGSDPENGRGTGTSGAGTSSIGTGVSTGPGTTGTNKTGAGPDGGSRGTNQHSGAGSGGNGTIPGGVPGGTSTEPGEGVRGGTGNTPGTNPSGGTALLPPGQTVNGDDPNGSRTGSLNGTRSGTGNGSQSSDGDGHPPTNPNGTNSSPRISNSGSQQINRPPSNPSGQIGGGGGSEGQPTLMDRITTIAGYWNLEFGSSPNGQSGGVAGGMGSHNWGAWGQALFLGLTVADIVLTVVSFGGTAGIKAGLKSLVAAGRRALTSVARLFTREGLRELGTKIATSVVRLLPGRRSFFSVQGAEDVFRLLQRGGHPWPQGFTNGNLRDIFGQGLYTFASREQAMAYLRMLEQRGVSGLRMLEHSVSARNLARFRTADLTRMTDEAANAILDLGANHGFQHISRMTGKFGVEHFFSREVFPFFRSWSIP